MAPYVTRYRQFNTSLLFSPGTGEVYHCCLFQFVVKCGYACRVSVTRTEVCPCLRETFTCHAKPRGGDAVGSPRAATMPQLTGEQHSKKWCNPEHVSTTHVVDSNQFMASSVQSCP